MMPHLMETVTQGVKQTEKIEILKITVNPKLDDTASRSCNSGLHKRLSSHDLDNKFEARCLRAPSSLSLCSNRSVRAGERGETATPAPPHKLRPHQLLQAPPRTLLRLRPPASATACRGHITPVAPRHHVRLVANASLFDDRIAVLRQELGTNRGAAQRRQKESWCCVRSRRCAFVIRSAGERSHRPVPCSSGSDVNQNRAILTDEQKKKYGSPHIAKISEARSAATQSRGLDQGHHAVPGALITPPVPATGRNRTLKSRTKHES